jgi:Creatinine amidohydrolase
MSWLEAKEAFDRSDTVIVPTGTLHAHGPTPIGIDATAAERLADEVGKRTGILTLPVVAYGEDEKMANYPGSIGISPNVLELYYADICINGHGGNREPLSRAGRSVRKSGMLVAILEWWSIGAELGFFRADNDFLQEMAIALAIHGNVNADLREAAHKGEWGANPTEKIFGDQILPIIFSNFKFRGGTLTIPVDSWDIDLASPPYVRPEELPALEKTGNELISKLADYFADFAREFEKIDAERFLKMKSNLKT